MLFLKRGFFFKEYSIGADVQKGTIRQVSKLFLCGAGRAHCGPLASVMVIAGLFPRSSLVAVLPDSDNQHEI